MSLLSSSIGGGVRFHADEDADHNMLQGKSRFLRRSSRARYMRFRYMTKYEFAPAAINIDGIREFVRGTASVYRRCQGRVAKEMRRCGEAPKSRE